MQACVHDHLHMCSHLQKQDRQWQEASGLEAFTGLTPGGTGSYSLFTDGVALPACIGFGLATLLGSGTGLLVMWGWDSFSSVKGGCAVGCPETCGVEYVSGQS